MPKMSAIKSGCFTSLNKIWSVKLCFSDDNFVSKADRYEASILF